MAVSFEKQRRMLRTHSFSTALLVATGTTVLAQSPEPRPIVAERGPRVLEAFVGRDLRHLEPTENKRLRESLSALARPPHPFFAERLRPWAVFRVERGPAKWVVLEAYPGYDVPDLSVVHLRLFDAEWSHLGSTLARTGYRMFIRDAVLVDRPAIDRDLVLVRTYGNGFTKKREERQFYAVLDDRIALVRLEDGAGRPIRNRYWNDIVARGPDIPSRTSEDWIEALRSDEIAVVLEALVWLAGKHVLSTAERPPDTRKESIADSKLFEAVRGWAASDSLRDLDTSHVWVEDAVELVFARETSTAARGHPEGLFRKWTLPIVTITVIGAIVATAILGRKRRRRASDADSG